VTGYKDLKRDWGGDKNLSQPGDVAVASLNPCKESFLSFRTFRAGFGPTVAVAKRERPCEVLLP
jgi:hypothetical protein